MLTDTVKTARPAIGCIPSRGVRAGTGPPGHVVSVQKRVDKPFGIERRKVIGPFAEPDQLHRYAE
jgi:hypothetical protein